MSKITIPIYRDLPKGDRTIVGKVELLEDKLPPDPFFSICLINQKVAPYTGRPVAASLVDDFNLCAALNNTMLPGQLYIKYLMNQR